MQRVGGKCSPVVIPINVEESRGRGKKTLHFMALITLSAGRQNSSLWLENLERAFFTEALTSGEAFTTVTIDGH